MPGTVTVACKHPHGLHLDVLTASGERLRKTIQGNSLPYGAANTTIGGYALTDVDADHWAAWVEQNRESALLKERIVFAQPKQAAAQAQAQEQAGVAPVAPPLQPDAVPGVEAAKAE